MDRTEGKTRIAVLVSGGGTNLHAILQACQTGVIDGTVAAVLSNRPGCAALEVGRQWGVPLVRAFPVGDYADRRARDRDMAEFLRSAAVDLVVTAGYDRVLDEDFVAAFPGRILNVHPSLLPAFAGTMQAIRDAFLAGVTETGVTVHFIEPDTVDAGTVAAQEKVPVLPGDTLETLEARVHETEHSLVPRVIQEWIEGRVRSPAATA
jgi:phosphoribosylglycinamide formyltransferase-1